MQLSDLMTLTRALAGDPLNESQSWSDDEVRDAINFAVLTYCEKTDCSYREEDISFTSGAGTVPFEYIRMERVIYSGEVLDWSDKDFEDRMNPNWRTVFGTPKRSLVYNGNTIRIVPGANVVATLGFIAKPDDLVADVDEVTPEIPSPHHPYLKYAAAAWLYMKDGDQQDLAKAQNFIQTFNSLIGKEPGRPPVETEE